MKWKTRWTLAVGGLASLAALGSLAMAQRPEDEGPSRPASKEADVSDLSRRMMAFDKDADGKLTRDELTDDRLVGLFDRADADKDNIVTRDELASLGDREHQEGRGFGPGGGPPGFGPGGPMMMMPRPGEVLPAMLQNRLRITPEQKTQLDELQGLVDSRLAKILDDDQKATLREIRERGPGRFGPPGNRPSPPRRGR